MKPSERIKELENQEQGNSRQWCTADSLTAIVKYLDEEWEKNQKPRYNLNVNKDIEPHNVCGVKLLNP